MQLLYISAPYRAKHIHQVHYNIQQAELLAQYYWLKGFSVICPHKNTSYFDGLVPDDVFLDGTLAMLQVCNHIAMHPNWKKSAGCVCESIYAKRLQKQFHYPNMDEVLHYLKEAL